MALVVFLRGVNVGGHKKFKPSILATELAKYDVVSLGAAGTFIVHGKVGAKALREEIRRRLPFEAEIMICTAEEIVKLVRRRPFGPKPPQKNFKCFVSVLQSLPRTVPRLPMDFPAKGDWEVRLLRVTGRFVLSLWRRSGRGILYPNQVFEKHFGVAATTRGWNTIVSICNTLQKER